MKDTASAQVASAFDVAQVPKILRKDRFELVAELDRNKALAGQADLALLRTVRACDRGELWRGEGFRKSADWIASRLGVSRWKARRMIEASHALERLPLTSAALERGVLSLDKTLELCRVATEETEADLIEWARRVAPAAIRERADLEATRKAKELEETQRLQHFTCTPDREQGIFWLNGILPFDQGAILAEELDRRAEEIASRPMDEALVATTSEEQWRDITADERRALALVEMATGQTTGDSRPQRATVVVHAPLEALSQDRGNGQLDGGGVLHPETVRKLSCDGRLQFVLHGKDGNALGIGETSRQVPRWLRRQVLHRDGDGCAFPGCEARRFLHIHHIEHWARGGPTDLDNLLTVCTSHHDLIHEGRWSVTRSPEGKLTWFRPSGRVYEVGPAPPRREDLPERGPQRHRLIEARCTSRLFLLADPDYVPSRKLAEWREAIRPRPLEVL
jgi:hypothetical protein